MSILNSIKTFQQKLQNLVGTNYERYLENMRDWFGQRVTKDFFDFEMSILLNEEALALHNEIMRLIILSCSPTSSRSLNHAAPEAPDGSTLIPTTTTTNNNNAFEIETNQSSSSVSTLEVPGNGIYTQQEPEYITVNFVESDEIGQYYENEQEEQIEDIKPNVPVDWLYNIEIIRPDSNDNINIPTVPSKERFPSKFGESFQRLQIGTNSTHNPDAMLNVTHGYEIADRLAKVPQLKKHFPLPIKENQPYLSVGSSIHGQFLLKAWEYGLDGVDINASNFAVEGVKEHIRSLVTALVKQRRAFRMRDNKIHHSIGIPYPNPYLRQGQQLYDDPYSSDTTQMADAMQVPSLLSVNEEKERLTALQIAASIGPKNECRFPATRVTVADLLDLIDNNPTIIPKTTSRLKLQEIAHQNYKGYGGSFYNDEYSDDERNILPLCSY